MLSKYETLSRVLSFLTHTHTTDDVTPVSTNTSAGPVLTPSPHVESPPPVATPVFLEEPETEYYIARERTLVLKCKAIHTERIIFKCNNVWLAPSLHKTVVGEMVTEEAAGNVKFVETSIEVTACYLLVLLLVLCFTCCFSAITVLFHCCISVVSLLYCCCFIVVFLLLFCMSCCFVICPVASLFVLLFHYLSCCFIICSVALLFPCCYIKLSDVTLHFKCYINSITISSLSCLLIPSPPHAQQNPTPSPFQVDTGFSGRGVLWC